MIIDGIDIERSRREFDRDHFIEREIAAGVPFGPFHQQWQLERAPHRVRRMLELAAQRPGLVGARQGYVSAEATDFPPAALRSAISATTTETNLWDPAIWSPIPALDMVGGKCYTVEYGGLVGTTGTPTQVWTARVGTNNSAPPTGVSLGASPTVTLGTITSQPFYGVFTMGVRSIGVAAGGATLTGNGFTAISAAAGATVTPHVVFGGAVPTTVDNTIAQGLSVSVTWGTNSASNTLTPYWAILRSLN